MLHSLHFLESKKHNIKYGVIADQDDVGTVVACQEIQKFMPLAFKVGERETSMGKPINKMTELMPADVYMVVNDDVLCLTPNWDEVIAKAVEAKPYGMFWWKNGFEQEVLYPIITEKWRAAAGRFYTEDFPFWYDDLVMVEVWTMTTDEMPIVLDITIADRPQTTTHRMRDLKFWQSFYTETRGARLAQSFDIAKKLGLPEPKYGALMAGRLDEHLKTVPDDKLDLLEKEQGDREPADPSYYVAKERAQRVLDSLNDERRVA